MRGHIKKRSKYVNSWTIYVDSCDPITGKRKQISATVKGNKRDAQRELRLLINKVEAGIYIKPTKETVREFLCRWIVDYPASSELAPKTIRTYQFLISRYILPNIGNILLSNLAPTQVQALYTKLIEKDGVSQRTALHVHRVLSQALNYAARQDLIPYNPASREKITPPRPKWAKINFVDEEQAMKLLDKATGSQYYDFFYLALWTGMRRNEILALRWQDIDLDKGTISVNGSIDRVNGRLERRETKTEKSCRTISISTSACDLLRQRKGQLIAQGLVPRDGDYIFSKADGQPYDPDAVTHAFAKIAKSAGLPHTRLHDLRHAHASFLIKQGIPAKVISERLGHSGISITMDTYGHLMPGMDGIAAQKFDEVFGR